MTPLDGLGDSAWRVTFYPAERDHTRTVEGFGPTLAIAVDNCRKSAQVEAERARALADALSAATAKSRFHDPA